MEHIGFPLEILLILVGVVIFSAALDLNVFQKTDTMSLKAATGWTLFWICMALLFYVYLLERFDKRFADLFLVGFVLEKSLSLDNLMVFMVIFNNFNLTGAIQSRVLFLGILGAIVFRIVFASIGTALFAWSPWIGFVFALIVGWTAWKMLTTDDSDEAMVDYSHHWSVRWTENHLPIFPRLSGLHLFIDEATARAEAERDPSIRYQAGMNRYATPALLCLVVVQMTDVMFSFDSVPAVVAVTQEPILVWSAMMFAVLGLRALYYVLAAMVRMLVHLGKAIVVLLFYIALKLAMGASNEIFHWPGIHISPATSLTIVACVLGLGVLASFLFPPKEQAGQ
ncbi:MAG: TerC/Alx family metal homeostasis membrane protein [Magnetococcales bacterium]|nr:TerC/Alx family metal homeostasis membrane protein [Magnetococcales bacterium]